ncbi:MAG: hypothetical protein QQN41_00125 [Nitrosopumilus sp.]
MAKTYEVTSNEKEEFVIETSPTTKKTTYQKVWLEAEIIRLQEILDRFPK